jgi:DNA repair protein SbcC/Rad50
MKILKIRFENINSLVGKHEIDFKDLPGIFAIVGPTGSGKSTILDVITLALYNYVPRLGRISKNLIDSSGALLSEHTQSCFAEVEYEAKNQQYRSHWEISRSRNGTLRDYNMSLSKLPEGELLDLKKSEVPAQNSAITGLDVDRFLKSMMLAQGDFTRFLKAKEEERSALLEKITGTDIYRRLGKASYEKSKEEREKLQYVQSQIDETKLLSDDVVRQYNKDLKVLDKSITELKKKHGLYRTYCDWKKKVEHCTQNKSKLEEERVLLEQSQKDIDLKKQEMLMKQQQKELKTHKPLLDEVLHLDMQIEVHKKAAKTLFSQVEDIELDPKYTEERSRLQEGESCYLCGSKHHPYRKEKNNAILQLIEQLQQERQDKFGNRDVKKEQGELERRVFQASQKHDRAYRSYQDIVVALKINIQQYQLNEEFLSKEEKMVELDVTPRDLLVLEDEIGQYNRQIGALTKELQIHDFWKKKFEALGEKVTKQQKEYLRWKMLSDVIGDAEGKTFSKFAQRLTLDYLVTLANSKLGGLTDRYAVVKGLEQNLSLEIQDNYQGGCLRSVATLSGGESFLVSLALALGLAELASDNTQIDSLFIDEGFGTLDQDTLDLALSTLENLQALSNKSIGIISHVDTLKERIKSQICLTKKSGGVSELKVVLA